MAKQAPTYAELRAAFWDLFHAFSEVDGLLDSFVSNSPDGATKDEVRTQQNANKVHGKALAILMRANEAKDPAK